MIPHSFTVTSHIIVTFAFAAMVWVVVTLIGFWRHGVGFLRLFVPSGVPWWLLPIIVPIELISYFIRPISHSVRLFANMMAGHTMLKVFAGFVVGLGVLGGWAPLRVRGGLHRPRGRGGLPAGTHLHSADLHLSQRRASHASLSRA